MSPLVFPHDVINRIVHYIEDQAIFDPRGEFITTYVEPPCLWHGGTRVDWANIRLVNKAWHKCVTPLLFQHLDVSMPTWHKKADVAKWAATVLELSQSPLTEHVEYLAVGCSWSRGANRALLTEYLMDAACVLPALLQACKRLQGLTLRGPSAASLDDYDSSDDEPVGEGDAPDETSHNDTPSLHRASVSDVPLLVEPSVNETPSVHELNLRLFSRITEHMLRQICAPTRSATLRILQIRLPLAYEYARLAETSTDLSPKPFATPVLSFMERLQHPRLTISDDSGPGGHRYDDESTDETDVHRRRPNTAHAEGVWRFIERATNLQSLEVVCSHVLDMDELSSDRLVGLEELSLYSVKVSPSNLIRLISQKKSTLKSLELMYMELKSGKWQEVLLQLCELPHLERFAVYYSGYDVAGDSRHQAILPQPTRKEARDIETLDQDDLRALGHAQRHVNAIRAAAGLALYTEDCWHERLAMPPLEDLELS